MICPRLQIFICIEREKKGKGQSRETAATRLERHWKKAIYNGKVFNITKRLSVGNMGDTKIQLDLKVR
jgi:hypothetical protein